MATRHSDRHTRSYLFVFGLSRSGTTALVRLLTGHGDIALGMERFKRLWTPERIKHLTSELFTATRFFDFADGLTNITPDAGPGWAAYYEKLREKYDEARYVGDKAGRLWLDVLQRSFPESKVVCVVRNVFDTAHSWQARADDSADVNWPSERGARAAVAHWNRALERVHDAQVKHPDSVRTLEYQSFFGAEDEKPLLAVLDFLGLPWDANVEAAWSDCRRTYRHRVVRKSRVLDEADRLFIDENADWGLWDRVRALAI